jgi:hypothetical protein
VSKLIRWSLISSFLKVLHYFNDQVEVGETLNLLAEYVIHSGPSLISRTHHWLFGHICPNGLQAPKLDLREGRLSPQFGRPTFEAIVGLGPWQPLQLTY